MNSSDELTDTGANAEPEKEPLWRAMTRMQRRVAGVLVEKSKTTPDIYPMTINAIKTGSNQKSNRSPLMDLREEQVDETLYELRHLGAVIEVHSGGRVPKFKHQLYEWLGVEKVELAVMAELLLRGEQTLGDLRARAGRMDKIAGINELRPIVESLVEKGLVIELTPPGRGQMVTHGLYERKELEQLKAQFSGYQSTDSQSDDSDNQRKGSGPLAVPPAGSSHSSQSHSAPIVDGRVDQLVQEITELKQAVESIRQQLTDVQELLK